MVLVGLLPLVVSHVFLIGINRDSLETLEKKYLTRSAVSIASDLQNLLDSNRQQLSKIAGSVRNVRRALPNGADPFTYAAETNWILDFMTPDSDIIAIRALNRNGQGAEAKPAQLEPAILREMEIGREVALKGQQSVGRIMHESGSNQPAVVIAVPVVDNNEVIGAIEGLVSLRRIVDRIRDEGKGDVAAFIVDRDGRVLIHSEPAIEVQHPNFNHLQHRQRFRAARRCA